MRRWKVSVEIKDGWRKDAEGIRNVKKTFVTNFDFGSFMTHF